MRDVGAFAEALAKSSSMIVLSEIGDKTFFIAALMAMRHSRGIVFLGASVALFLMTAISAVAGAAATGMVSARATHRAATGLFFLFGARAIWEASKASDDDEGELAEVEAELNKKRRKSGGRQRATLPAATVFAEAFAVTFLAEWGDRSQIATVGLAASEDVVGVTLGGCLGHALCTGLAVLGGRSLADRAQDSERIVGALGGVLFLLFGAHSLWTGPPE